MLKLRDMLKFRPAEMTKWVSSLQSSEHLWCYNRTQSLVAVQNAFRQRFPGRNPPSINTILQNSRKYSEHGTSLNRNKNNSGRPRTARSQQNIAAVRRLLEQNPQDVECSSQSSTSFFYSF
jgi:hypothetical protein